MAVYIINSDTLEGLANAIRSVNGSSKEYTPEEMIEEVTNIMDAATFILVDKDGNEYPAVYVDSNIEFTATEDDIRLGKTAITGAGVVTGTKDIPNYRAEEGLCIVKSGKGLDIPLYSDMCEYTHLQSILCEYNTTVDDSVSAEKVVIHDIVYEAGTVNALANVTVDSETQTIKLGLTNENEHSIVVRYTIIKEDA